MQPLEHVFGNMVGGSGVGLALKQSRKCLGKDIHPMSCFATGTCEFAKRTSYHVCECQHIVVRGWNCLLRSPARQDIVAVVAYTNRQRSFKASNRYIGVVETRSGKVLGRPRVMGYTDHKKEL